MRPAAGPGGGHGRSNVRRVENKFTVIAADEGRLQAPAVRAAGGPPDGPTVRRRLPGEPRRTWSDSGTQDMRDPQTAFLLALLAAALALGGCAAPLTPRPTSALIRPASAPVRTVPEKPAIPQPRVEPATPSASRSAAADRGETEFFAPPAAEPAEPGGSPVRPGRAGGRMALNLQDADVRTAIDVVLGEALKVPYTVSPQVQGRVTLNTGRALPGEALLVALEAALAGVSAALVVNGNQYEVVPLDAVPQRVRQAYVMRRGERSIPGYAVQFVPLRHAAAADVQRLLEVIAPKGVVLQSDPVRNRVVIAGSGAERANLARTIEELDTDSMQGMTVGLFRLRHVGAEQVLGEIRQLFRSSGDFVDGRLRLIPMERIRTVVGIAPRRADLERIEAWIRRLDEAPPAAERRLHVIPVQHTKARELADTLQLVLTGESSPSATGAAAAFGIGDAAQRPMPGFAFPSLGQPAAPPGAAPGTSPPGMAFPGSPVPGGLVPGAVYPGMPFQGVPGGSAASRGATLRIVANDDNNSLVLYGTEAEHRLVREAMLQLDQPARQVLIEAVIAEITLNDDLRFGVQWFFDSNGSQATFTNSPVGSVLSQFPGFSYFRALSADSRLVINALQSKTDVNVLSAPRLSVLNNRRAQLMVGDEVPILSQVSQSAIAPGAPLVSNITMRDTGVMLEVVPRIGDSGTVVLEVTQEVSDVAVTTTSGIDSPTIQRRRLRSIIATRDGATVALGGLIREAQSKTRSGVPLLKDVPWVGALFRNDAVNTKRTELVILLVPRLMRNDEDNLQALEDFMSGFKASADLMRDGIRSPLQFGN